MKLQSVSPLFEHVEYTVQVSLRDNVSRVDSSLKQVHRLPEMCLTGIHMQPRQEMPGGNVLRVTALRGSRERKSGTDEGDSFLCLRQDAFGAQQVQLAAAVR